jgi:hypothetical protein
MQFVCIIWLVTILCKILNLKVVAKWSSWKDPPSWKREILHVIFITIHKYKLRCLPYKLILGKFYQNWRVHDDIKCMIFTFVTGIIYSFSLCGFDHRDAWNLHTNIIWSKRSTDFKELSPCSVWYPLKPPEK